MAITGRNDTTGRRLRLGMVGGGKDAFIGAVHRIASRIDGEYELVAGAYRQRPSGPGKAALPLGWRQSGFMMISKAWPYERRA